MTRRQQVLWGSVVALGLALLGLAAFLGLDRADKVFSIFSGLAGLIGIGIGIHQLQPNRSRQPVPHQVQRAGDNSTNIQSGGDITIGNNNKFGENQ
ncbi:hypothetical protein ACIQWR_07030 [Streptomyces sp. NPDC098789]|uniref:hypothetical protein n=1 Tax=Streptomyces sp. NPDC098789 TaxID=3366098 RepID=UPI003807BC72